MAAGLPVELRRAIAELARTPRLLITCDYDKIVASGLNGVSACPLPEAVHALRSLAGLPATSCAVISGRALPDLAMASRLPAEVHLVGRDGAETDPRFPVPAAESAGEAFQPGEEGDALDVLRTQTGATATLSLSGEPGGDVAARLLRSEAESRAGREEAAPAHRIGDARTAVLLLELLAEERRLWSFGAPAPPIERLSMLSNQWSIALLGPDARLMWFCRPDPDSGAVFAELLGGREGGHFAIRPDHSGRPLGQRYLPGTMTVQTRWSRLLVTDYLAHDTAPHRTDIVRVISGSAPAVVEFAPRPEFGRVPVRLVREGKGLRILGAAESMVLYSPGVEWEISSDGANDVARGVARPAPGRPVLLELRCGTDALSPPAASEPQRREHAGSCWSDWLAGLRLPETDRELVARSALTLRGLCRPDGAVLAAATTSLPEEIGGVRNWDYRYCWVRDAALSAQALVSLGSTAEAEAFLGWVHRVLESLPGPELLRPLYTLRGDDLGPESVIEALPGYAGSRPVRIGNLADRQVQLDVFGPVVELVAQLAEARGRLPDGDWDLVVAMTEAVARRWHEPDHGIWEERLEPRHHVYSRVMCWLTIDRAIRLARRHGRELPDSLEELRATIAADVLERGWNDEVQAFTTAYDGTDLDAASLHIGLAGLIEPSDERFQATVTAIEEELRSGPAVYRYRRDDGLPGGEGGFHLCAAWLIEAYLLTGRRTEAEELFKQLVACVGPTGLLPEEYDPVSERSLGNHPQAYSHMGLIRCARLLDGM
ncbi:trehalase-like domain-containing protein [Allosalinactinospora lopnorensis]|uniref:trehalase-like domain-containing protein n=1 Tax=Allosalinactinospora lopnorensis TaxID=1352348 RepID=UPI000623DC68|nr:trehalase-like domain-containing protein [Allosalinactinospora lopnorensis]